MTSLMLVLAACGSASAPAPEPKLPEDEQSRLQSLGYMSGGEGGAPGGNAAPASAAAPEEKPMEGKVGRAAGRLDADKKEADDAPADGSKGGEAGKDDGEAAAPPRAWFPESFLWQPIVEVPASGTVTVPIPVPDTLTTWRILALGQTRSGAQAGALASFASTLPAYVDLSLPTFLYAGDRVQIPVQAMNQQGEPLSAGLDVQVTGGTGSAGGSVSVPAYGSHVETVVVGAPHAGDLHVVARLGSLDAVDRVVPVRPTGRPVDAVRGGTLAGPRTFTVTTPLDGTDGSLVVTVFPGALGVVRQELGDVGLRGDSLADAAYAWAVAGMAGPLVEEHALAGDVVRGVTLRAWQRIAKATRAPGVVDSTTALAAIRLAPGDTLAGRLAIRLAENLKSTQAADGLWAVAPGAPLDQALEQTARAVWALGADNKANRLRATGAFERQRERLTSPYLAAWALTAQVVDPPTAEKLRATVRDALHTGADGAKTLRVTATRSDGTRVPEVEATALAILALPDDDPARADLAAGLLGLYQPGAGFGDGRASLLALQAVQAVFHGEIPREVSIRVEVDGAEAGRAVLDPSAPHAPVHLTAPALAGGEHQVKVTSEPAVPGLAFTALARTWVPWTPSAPAGLEVAVAHPATFQVGVRSALTVSAAAPAGVPLDISLGLPAGVEPDRMALDALVQNGRIGAWIAEDGRITLQNVPMPGGSWSGEVPVTPTLAGSLLADAGRVWPSGDPDSAWVRVPERWEVR